MNSRLWLDNVMVTQVGCTRGSTTFLMAKMRKLVLRVKTIDIMEN